MIARVFYSIFIGTGATVAQALGVTPFWYGPAFGLLFFTLLAILMETVK